MGSLGFALWVVGFIRDRWVHKVRTGVVRLNWDRWVHSRSPWVSLGLSRGVRFTRIGLGGGRVYPGSFGSLGFALVVVGFIRSHWVHSGSPLCRGVLSQLLDSLWFALGVVGFIRGGWVR